MVVLVRVLAGRETQEIVVCLVVTACHFSRAPIKETPTKRDGGLVTGGGAD